MHRAADPAQVAAARSGDRQALESLLAEHLPLIYGVVRRALGTDPDVDDVVQETMLRAVRHLRGLRDPEGFKSWLVAIAVRQIQERSRRLARRATRVAYDVDIGVDGASLPDPGADFTLPTEERIDLARELHTIAQASGFLTPADRQLLALWSQEVAGSLTRAEVASALALSPAHTAVRVQRMRARLDLALAVVRAWQASPRCSALGDAALSWDRSAEPRWLKRLGRHVRDCGQCTLAGRHRAPAAEALAAPWLLPVPAALAGQVSSLAATAAGGGLGSATIAAVADSIRRTLGYVNVKSAGLAGAGLAGATAAAVLAVHMVTEVADPVPAPPAGLVALPPAGQTPAGQTPAGTTPGPSVSARPAAPPALGAVAGTAVGVTRADFYVAPDGDDAGPGTAAQPFATLGKAVSVVRPGQVIALRGGTYRPVKPVAITTSGTEQQRITVSNLVGERPVIDAAGLPAGGRLITHTASFWTVQGLEIKNAPSYAYMCRSCRQNVFRRLWVHNNGNTGLVLHGTGTVGNQILDSDFSRNHDTVDRGGDADGLSIKSGSGAGNLVRGCRFAENSGDGLDLTSFIDPVTVTSNWAYGNGHNRWQISDFNGPGNGVKLGGGSPAPAVDHVVTDNASWDNAGYGFTDAGNRGRLTLTNNTAYRNGGTGFAFRYSSSRLRRNLALANARDVQLGAAVDDADNSWHQSGWTTTILRSGDPTTARGERTAAGLFPPTTFLLNRKDTTMGASMTATGGARASR
ncbi:sigma-70 family RNA polymerase sigma factor [Micromonospora sp. KC606]|uniref:sigma-70 family RNA polymerase sigma factor n=1 Tax=Micromonospora sp. KC606 TaxID=2530379 RepID=UPI001053CA22|nr:sigma-70 family RNA polymerase sigma factor [Micromonospora sp. KC606]TDC84207.1 sigma-70 family RNA polymerase sigma factor [Micromonospora sp. KC606]